QSHVRLHLLLLLSLLRSSFSSKRLRLPGRPAGSAAHAGEHGSTKESWCRFARKRRTALSAGSAVRAGDALRARRSRLRYCVNNNCVGAGVEPATDRLTADCASRLSYPDGGESESRTHDLRLMRALLYR